MSFKEPDILPSNSFNETNQEGLLILIYLDLRNIFQMIGDLIKKFWLLVVLILLIFIAIKSTIFITETGYIDLYENPITHDVETYDRPAIHWKIPLSSVTRYKRVWIVDFGTGFGGQQIREEKSPIQLRFADSYTANIPATFRYKLPNNRDLLEMIHKDFTTHEKLVDALLIPISRDVMVTTATQYTGEEFFQGGLNQFRMALEDQLQNGIYKTKREEVEVNTRDIVMIGQNGFSNQKTTSLKVWKTVPITNAKGEIERLEKKSLVNYGIEVIQVTLGVPEPEPELEQLLTDKKEFDRISNKKADELAMVFDNQKIMLANIEKEKQTQLATIEKDKIIHLANISKEQELKLARKSEELALIKESQKNQLAQKAKELVVMQKQLELVLADQEIQKTTKETELAIFVTIAKAKEEEKLAIDLATIKARKDEELVVAKAEQEIQLANKAKELAIVQEIRNIELAEKAKEFAIIEETKKIQLANKARELAIVHANQKLQIAQKSKELAIIQAEQKIQIAKKESELIVSQAELDIQKANLEAAQFEAKVIVETGKAEAEIMRAKYEARISDIYIAEIQRDIVAIIYPNLKDINLTMPHNIVNFGASDNKLPTNLDVLSSFANIGIMNSLEKKATAK
ncbi:MAG: SPFH domain-containing protein [Candidatus Marithrix sp.]